VIDLMIILGQILRYFVNQAPELKLERHIIGYIIRHGIEDGK